MSHVIFTPDHVEIDGKPVRIVSGAMHYFRTRPEQWRDRMEKAAALGLNAIETYFCWNLHEPHPGEWDTAGMLDFVRFIETAHELGLWVIARPGPYVCAEWENGGLPPWLAAKPGMRVRRMNQPYLDAVDGYFRRLLPLLRPLLASNGGPVIAVQIENEYGSYGEDKEYLAWLRGRYRDAGIDVPLFTADGGGEYSFLLGGSLADSPVALTFGPGNIEEFFRRSRDLHPASPPMCMEYWLGAFDHWGETHHTVDAGAVTDGLERMLKLGASVNLYMFHGGTNFGFTNGANMVNVFEQGKLTDAAFHKLDYAPTTTSYDYDSLLDEAGDPTPKYFAVQQVLRRYCPEHRFGTPLPGKKHAYGKVALTESADLLSQRHRLAKRRDSRDAEPMEFFGQNTGFILYRTHIPGPLVKGEEYLRLFGVRDRAQLYLDGSYLGTTSRNEGDPAFALELDGAGAMLDILVENLGRVNYGPECGRDCKGLLDGAAIRNKILSDYEVWPLPLEDLAGLEFGEVQPALQRPRFYRGHWQADEVADTYLRFPGVKGVVWINGVNIGRYWNIGPGNALYIPWPLLRRGVNEIIVLELHELNEFAVEFTATREWQL